MNQQEMSKLIEQVIREVVDAQNQNGQSTNGGAISGTNYVGNGGNWEGAQVESSGAVPDLSAIDFKQIIDVPNPESPERFARMRANTVARVGVWRAGPRYRTNTYLRFRADHAAAMDAVFTDVSQELLQELNMMSVTTLCDSKDMFLTRPDLGRRFSDESIAAIKKECKANPDVQIVVADGLSSTSIEANIKDTLPALIQGLQAQNISVGTPFFVQYGRVGSMDPITEALGAKVTVILIGERPGLASGESMSAYMTYDGKVGMPEKNRTVVSNIHKGGTNAVEAGAFIAELCQRMLTEKVSGLELKL